MATKAEERKALDQIRKIVEKLGEESYVGRAFEGCFDMAQENIDNDFWNSPKECLKTARENLRDARNEAQSERMMADTQREQVKGLKTQVKETNDKNAYLQATIKAMAQEAEQAQIKSNKALTELSDKLIEEHKKAQALEQEIIKLKAKLYDMMVGA